MKIKYNIYNYFTEFHRVDTEILREITLKQLVPLCRSV